MTEVNFYLKNKMVYSGDLPVIPQPNSIVSIFKKKNYHKYVVVSIDYIIKELYFGVNIELRKRQK